MSTVIYFLELMMMSLIGMMFYKLYLSYQSWKTASAFSDKSPNKKPSRLAGNIVQQNSPKRILEFHNSDYLLTHKIDVSEDAIDDMIEEAQSSSILNDYISEFFVGVGSVETEAPITKPEDRDLFSVSEANAEATINMDNRAVYNATSNNSEEEYITVESTTVLFKDVSQETLILPKVISPDVKDFSDIEPDSFITVSSFNDESPGELKVMSDKVVMAMLNEAKVVRAS